MFCDDTQNLSKQVLNAARKTGRRIAVAESCTGGLLSSALTHHSGASDVFECGFVTYSYAAKSAQLGVPPALLQTHGAVSEQVAILMAEGALNVSGADLVLAITGIAGPGGASANKPVGLVCFAAAKKGQATIAQQQIFEDKGRNFIQMQSVKYALSMLLKAL